MMRHVLLLIGLLVSFESNAAMWSGAIDRVRESTGLYYWGDGVNDLFQQWSSGGNNKAWFYASGYGTSNADVYVYKNLTDVSNVTDASAFTYTTGGNAVAGYAGDTIFFRGTNGYYGAWRVDQIENNQYLSGRWYFLDDMSSDFSVPLPAAAWLFLSALGGLGILKRFRK